MPKKSSTFADPKIVSIPMRTETPVAQIYGLHLLVALTGGNSPLLFCTGKRGSSHGKLVLFLPTLSGLGWSIYNDEAYLVAREQKFDDLESSHIGIFLGKSKGLWNISWAPELCASDDILVTLLWVVHSCLYWVPLCWSSSVGWLSFVLRSMEEESAICLKMLEEK